MTWVQREYAPTAMVDLATLTGAILAALATEYAGVFSNNDALAGQLAAAGDSVGERLWRLPMDPAYDKMIDSPIADMKNVGGALCRIDHRRAVPRALCRERDLPWAHLDIAGMVWSDKAGRDLGQGRDRLWRAPARSATCGTAWKSDRLEISGGGADVRVDFYQLARDPAEAVLPLIARNTLAAGERLVVVSRGRRAARPDRPRALGQAARELPGAWPRRRRA